MDLINVRVDVTLLGGLLPGIVPVDRTVSCCASADDFQHPLGPTLIAAVRFDSQRKEYAHIRILLSAAITCTVSFEIVDHRVRVLADVTKVDLLTALAKEQQAIKDLEQFRRRLMNPVRKKVRQ
jgi:hypothetical protein